MEHELTKGPVMKTMLLFAVPMILGDLLQQCYNIADTLIVGRFLGADALAAVGASSSITFLFVAIATGLSIGSSVVISQYFGAKRYGEMKTAIQTVLLASFVIALCLMLVGIFGTWDRVVFRKIRRDPGLSEKFIIKFQTGKRAQPSEHTPGFRCGPFFKSYNL